MFSLLRTFRIYAHLNVKNQVTRWSMSYKNLLFTQILLQSSKFKQQEMEYRHKCPSTSFRIELMKLLPLLLDEKPDDEQVLAVTPSNFMKEMVLTTEERLEKLKRASRKVKVRDELSLNTLKAVPDIIIFQNLEVGGAYTIPLTILNTYEVSKPLKIIWEPSPAFKISHSTETICMKVAPGMAYQFNVTLSVSEVRDYNHKITFATNGEVFEVPLIAIAPRPLLDLPDFITVPTTLVKIPSERTILVRNLGRVPAIFNLYSKEPYHVSPSRGILEPNQCMQISIYFNTNTAGIHQGQMILTYQTGEQLTIGLCGCSNEADIYLEKKELQMTESFMGLRTHEFIKLVNKSNHIIHFQFKLYEKETIEKEESKKYLEGFEMIKENEQIKVSGLVETGIVENRHAHENIYERIYVDELQEYEATSQFVYKNPIFEITPNVGEIWPNNDIQLLVIFSPTEAIAYESVAYLEVTGREKRIPLKLTGSGIGPLIQLNVKEIEANNIFLCSVHQYEVTVRNIGDIPANVKYFHTKPNFGGVISFTPEKWHLEPDSCASFVMQFSSNVQGKFVEEIKFVITESGEIMKFIFKGDIICPLLNFDTAELYFHNVSLGFLVKKYVRLTNTTQVPIEFNISIEPDGTNPAMSCEEYAKCINKPKISNPKEFSVSHVEGVAKPNTVVYVEVSLLPNKEGRHVKELKVQMWKSNKYSMTLPIKYYCHLPHIICETKELQLRGCFINYFYNRKIVLKNKNSYPGYFVILPQDASSREGVMYLPKISEDFIEPYEEKEVDIEISTNIVGQLVTHVFLSIFGENSKLHLCTITCNGQGPVLSISESLNFGNVKTLKHITETIEIVNDSPIVANVTSYKSSKSVYEIEEHEFKLEPSAKKDLAVKMYFRQPGVFIEKLQFDVENSERLTCTLKAVAVGSSILTEPALDGEYNIGHVFTYQQYKQNIHFTNMGSKHHKIMWSRKKTIRNWKESSSTDIASIFSLIPNRYELAPGQSIECLLTGYAQSCGKVEEDFYCHALVGNKKQFGVIASFIAIAEFVNPVLEISKDVMEFRVDKGINTVYEYLVDSLFIKNKSKIPVSAKITIDAPFYIVQNNKRISSIDIYTEYDKIIEFAIEFVPVSQTKRCMISEGQFVITYNSHPNKVKMLLRGEENYPNVKLEPRFLNFGCLPNFFTSPKQILMQNISPLPVSYHWEWIQDGFQTRQLDVVPIRFPEKIESPSTEISRISSPNFTTYANVCDYLESEKNLVYKRYEIEVPNFPDKKIEDLREQMEKIKVTESVRKCEYFKEIQIMLYQFVAKFDAQEEGLVAMKSLYSKNVEKSQIQEILELIPSHGYLGPFESQVISLEFFPCPNTFVEGIAHCHIAGGDVEITPVSGKAANISFSIDKNYVDFGRTLFCDISERRIMLENTGFTEFRYKVRGCSDNYKKSVLPQIYSLFVIPIEGVLLPGEKQYLQIKFFPGLTGEFTRQFTLQVAFLNSYTITIHGYAMSAQMICFLPRPFIETEEINLLSYGAIGAITEEFLNEVKSFTQTKKKYESDVSYICKNNLKDEGWVVITYKDLYPNIHDIDLAINRKLINEYLLCKPLALEEHTVHGKLRILPQLALMPYLVDFGYVIRDTMVHYSVLLENYGPTTNTLNIQFAKGSPYEMAFDIQITNLTLKVGDVAQLFIVFHPSVKIFPMVNQEIKHEIYFSSSHAPRIPIQIKAFLTLPEITALNNSLTFESVAMGNCTRKSISLQNNGFVESRFVCKVYAKSKPSSPFYIKIREGICEPSESFILDVYFEPKTEGKLRGSLVISVDQNQSKVVVRLKGTSVKPTLKIIGSRICFLSTLPYMQNLQLPFTVENTSPLPIEYFFPDFDDTIDLEEQILKLIMEYYKVKQVYLPLRTPGSGLPSPIRNFYCDLLNKVKEKVMLKDNESSTMNLNGGDDKIIAKKKNSSLGKHMPDINDLSVSCRDLVLEKDFENFENLLYEELAALKQNFGTNTSLPDPVRDALIESRPPIPENDPPDIERGILIIFHGLLGINYCQIVNKVGLNMKLPVYNVDQLIFDALIEKNNLAAIKIMEIIEENFSNVASETDLVNPPYFDERDILQRKIDVLLSGKQKKTDSKSAKVKDLKSSGKASKGSLKKKEEKKSSSKKSSQRSNSSKNSKKSKTTEDKRSILFGIPEDFLFELVQIKLCEFKSGLVIENLDSVLLRRPMLVLDYLLKGIGNIQYIHCIIFSQTYSDYIMYAQIEKQKEDKRISEIKTEEIQAVIDMDRISFEHLSPEDKALFKQDVLIPRKLNTSRKREQLKLRLDELKNKKQRDKLSKRSLDTTERLGDRKEASKLAKAFKDSKQSKPKISKSNKPSKTTKQSSKKSSKGSKKGEKVIMTEEELEIKKMFNIAEKLCSQIMHTLEYWDRKESCLTKPLPEKFGETGTSKKSKRSSKSSKTSMKTMKQSESIPKLSSNITEDDETPRDPKEELQLAKQIGIPCWYINNVHSGKIEQISKDVSFYLQHTPELKNAKTQLNIQDVKRQESPMELFTCIPKPLKTREKRVSNIFALTNQMLARNSLENKQESMTSSDELQYTTKDSKMIGSRKRKHIKGSKSRQSIFSDGSSLTLQNKSKHFHSGCIKAKDLEVEQKLIARNVLNPGEVVTYYINFLPKECGSYQHSYNIELVGWPSKYEIFVEGTCDIPRVNMKEAVLFNECVLRKEKDKLYKPNLYVIETGFFDFGSILIPPIFIHLENSRIIERVSAFHFENISSLPCETTLFLKNEMDTTFQVESNMLLISPNEIKDVRISSYPEKVGANENKLLISIKNNPKVEEINMCCVGCEIEFNIYPRVVCFERGLLNVMSKKVIKLCNESLVPVIWKVSEPTAVQDYFKISDVRGRILPCSKQKFEITFKPDVIQEIPKRELEIEVYDEGNKLPEPISSDIVEIYAEVINVEVDFPTEINFGEVKGKMEHTIEFPILSRVKYDIEFAFLDIAPYTNYYEYEEIRKMFNVTPRQTILNCDKEICAFITFFPKHAINFVNIPIFQCIATDPIFKRNIKSTILKATAKTYLSSYELCPLDEIDFNHQLVGTEKLRELSLKNTGKFEFTYTILSLRKIQEQKEKKAEGKRKKKKKKKKGSVSSKSSSKKLSSKKSDAVKTLKSSKASKGSTEKGKKNTKEKGDADKKAQVKPMKMDVGCFSIVPSTGIVKPNEKVLIKVTSKPKQESVYEEKIFFFISECSNRKGHVITLSVKGAIPKFNFQNLTDIFIEHYVVNTLKDFVCPEQLDFHCVYITDEQTLYFNKVCINTTANARMRLQNLGLTPVELITQVTPNTVFSVTPRVLVQPFNFDYITVCFTPNEINIFTAVLEVAYEVPSDVPAEKLQIQLLGECFIPEISILDPERNPAINAYQLLFNPTLVGKSSSRTVCFENCGIVACRVILDICQDAHHVLSLKPKDSSIVKTISNTNVLDMKHTMVISLSPKQKGVFEIEFKPESKLKLNSILKLHIVNNPFEVFLIYIKAISFSEDIVLEGLLDKPIEKPTKSSDSIPEVLSNYELNFGFCTMNTLQKKCFKIKNCSELSIYRFEFTDYNKLIFIPAVGHLKPGACKEILTTFWTGEPVNFSQVILNCIICKIKYVHPQYEVLSWDQRQNLIVWDQFSDTSLRHKIKSAELVESKSTKSKSITSKNLEENLRHSGGNKTKRMKTAKSESAVIKVRKLENRTEPEYIELAATTQTLQLSLNITADYCSYECDVKQIIMEDTLLFEKRSALFSVRNTSVMPLYLEWKISMEQNYQKKINSSFENLASKARSPRSANFGVRTSTKKPSRLKPEYLSGRESFLPDECPPQTSTKLNLFSSGSVTSRTNDSWCEQDLEPFTVTPTTIEIPALTMQTFTVTFNPIDVFQYVVHLKSDIRNSAQDSVLDVTVSARSLLPPYHFNLEPTNYLQKNSQRKICNAYENENMRVVELEVIGLGVSTIKTFHIINPTGENFKYKWTPSEVNGEDLALFHCHTPKGVVTKEKMAEAIFSFLPQEIGTFEAFYTFHIEKYDLKTAFLFVGIARNPCVFFSKPHLKLKATILSMDVSATLFLKNNENLEIHFEFVKASLYSGDHIERLIVKPSEGNVMAHGEVPIHITYHPIRIGEVVFRLKCQIELLKKPLNLTVTANCFDIQPDILYVDEDTEISLDPQKITNITLNSLIMESKDLKFVIKNKGKIGFCFIWSYKKKFLDEYVKLEFKDGEGYVSSNDENTSTVMIKPIRTLTQKIINAKLQIRFGPSYSIYLICTTVKTKYKFSFCEYDFGPCLIQQDKTTYYKCSLEFTNCDASPLILELTSDKCDHLSVMFEAKEIAPKKTKQIIIYFHPLQIGTYADEMYFFVNSKLEKIKIRGEGVPVAVEVENLRDKIIDCGSVMADQSASKTVKVVNRSVCTVYVIFDLYERLPYFSRPKKILSAEYERELPDKLIFKKKDKKEKKKSDASKKTSKKNKNKSSKSAKSSESKKSKGSKKSKSSKGKKSKNSKNSGNSKSNKDKKKKGKDKDRETKQIMETQTETEGEKVNRLIREFTSVTPKTFIKLLPGGNCEFSIKFSPKERMSLFSEKICYQVQDYIGTICVFKTSCIASDYYLSSDKISFGNVIKNNSAESKFTLYNVGDIGGKYIWKFARGKHPFTITPMEGYLSPDTSVTFISKFKPLRFECDLKITATCSIEHFNKKLKTILTGTCVNLPKAIETLQFTCTVRTEVKKDILIKNPTDTVWYVVPIIENKHFYVPRKIKVDPCSSANCEVIYKPKTMTFGDTYKGSMYLKISNGGGIVYNLEGKSEKPLPLMRIEKTIPCKTYHTEILEVENWLNVPQQFKVVTENLKPAETVKQLYKLTGNTVIDVPAKKERNYKWIIYVLKEGALEFNVSFVNSTTQEYLFYEIYLNVIQCESIEEITLKTCARIPVLYRLKLENPIKNPVTFSIKSESNLLHHEKLVTVPPLCEYLLNVEYLPILADETNTVLEITSTELGKYPYKFNLISERAVAEPSVHMKAYLGQKVTQKIGLQNIIKAKAEFISQLDNNDQFSVNPFISVEPEQKEFFEITFEPDGLGNFQTALTLNSSAAGEYIYPLIGTSVLPKPQGPIYIKHSGISVINFKNPFNDTRSFIFAIEPKVFYLKTYSEIIKAKTMTKINIFLQQIKKDNILISTSYPLTGKLTVTCELSDVPTINWVYYLQADFD